MFYDIYENLCKRDGKKPYAVAREIGLGNSNVAQWKKGSTPRPDVLQKIADYFHVSTGYLMGLEQKENPTAKSGEVITKDQFLNYVDNTDDMDTLLAILDAVNKKMQERK